MRKRNIKSVAHWVIMSFVLLFPILMVGISSFGNHETINVVEERPIYYESNEVVSNQDLHINCIYHWSDNFSPVSVDVARYLFRVKNTSNIQTQFNVPSNIDTLDFVIGSNVNALMIYTISPNNYGFVQIVDRPFDFVLLDYLGSFSFTDTIISYITESSLLLVESYQHIEYVQNYYMREDVNQWCDTFRNLPVNVWYGNLLSAIGLGITTSMMMNVIYTYPLYVLWVYILDLVVDIFLVIINFGHNALRRLGGDNE